MVPPERVAGLHAHWQDTRGAGAGHDPAEHPVRPRLGGRLVWQNVTIYSRPHLSPARFNQSLLISFHTTMNTRRPFSIVALTAFARLMRSAFPAEPPAMPQPTKEHEWLKKFAGEWETATEIYAEEGKPPLKATGK